MLSESNFKRKGKWKREEGCEVTPPSRGAQQGLVPSRGWGAAKWEKLSHTPPSLFFPLQAAITVPL